MRNKLVSSEELALTRHSQEGERLRRTFQRKVSTTLIVVGVAVIVGLVLHFWFFNQASDKVYDKAQQQLQSQPLLEQPVPGEVQEAPVLPSEGEALAVLRIPRFGEGYQPVIVEGISPKTLEKGPGHYPGTALPGEIGNFVVSGHRTTYGSPFNRIDELRPGDEITVQVQGEVYTYHVTGSEIVSPDAGDVVAPVPHHPGEEQTKAILTLTTCHPKYSAAQRLIVYAELN